MSEDVSKTVVRFYLKVLDNASIQEAYDYFNEKIGKPQEVDIYEDGLEYFNYSEMFSVKEDSDKWYFDVILSESSDGDYHCINMSFKKLFEIVEHYGNIFGINDISDINIASYTWYNGVDEPFEFVKE